MSDLKEIGNIFKGFLDTTYKKLDKLSIVNILIVFGVFLYVIASSFGDFLILGAYALGDIIGQLFFNKTIHQNIDTTPIYVYIGILFFALLFCNFLVKKHIRGKLW